MNPTHALNILAWLLLPVAAFHALYWFAVAIHYARTMLTIPRGREAAKKFASLATSPAPLPTVCVIVPAHNEEACISLVARALRAQTYPGLRMVFALDRCTDGTERVLREALGDTSSAEILAIAHCPNDWAGKSHALWRAVHDTAAARESDIVVFIDADTIPAPNCITACVGLLRERGLSLLSLLSTLTCDKPFERIAQPAAVFELMRQFPIVRANSPTGKRPFANGQFIMVKRADYLAFGGHEAIRWAVLEDIEIARQAVRQGFRAGIFVADELLTCRMYASFAEFSNGWRRIYRESCNNRPSRLFTFAWRLRLLGSIVPVLTLACLAVGAALHALDPGPLATAGFLTAFVGLLIWAGVLSLCYHAMRTGWHWAWTYPLGCWQVSTILFQAAREQARNVPIRWGGREYIRKSR